MSVHEFTERDIVSLFGMCVTDAWKVYKFLLEEMLHN